ncbi:MAG: amino acid permease, partial [Minisyncoccales bacterium]
MFIFDDQIELESKIGFWALLLMVFSGALGGGFFTLLGIGAGIAGPLLPFSFIIAGIIAFIVSRVYAELTTSIPAPGGGQVYIRNAFGGHPSLFIVYWLTWLGQVAYAALNAIGLGLYLSLILPSTPMTIALISIGLLVLINLYGIDNVTKIELFIGFAFVLALIGVIGFII